MNYVCITRDIQIQIGHFLILQLTQQNNITATFLSTQNTLIPTLCKFSHFSIEEIFQLMLTLCPDCIFHLVIQPE
jgi:hypothetical protein